MKKLYSSNSEQLRCVCKFTDVDDTKLRLLPETLTIQELAQIEPYFREPSNKTDNLTTIFKEYIDKQSAVIAIEEIRSFINKYFTELTDDERSTLFTFAIKNLTENRIKNITQ